MSVWHTLAAIFGSLYGGLAVLRLTLTPQRGGVWLVPASNASKRAGEVLSLQLSPLWIASVGVVVATGVYEWWGRWGYLVYCVTCAAPHLLVPLLSPAAADKGKPWSSRYIVKANAWIAIFSFVGNYWYTHYFYRVLKADYTFDAHRLNDVPTCLYFMTHAYFMFYHALSNAALRRVRTGFAAGPARTVFECALVVVLSYTTAFMESLTICGFPYYRFENRDQAYTLGSAFYGIYFLVSFPAFLRVDEDKKKPFTLAQSCTESLAASMAVLCLLDFVRLALGVELFTPH